MAEFKPKVWMACPLCGKQSPMPDPDAREWVGLTTEEMNEMTWGKTIYEILALAEAKLKEKNT